MIGLSVGKINDNEASKPVARHFDRGFSFEINCLLKRWESKTLM